MKKKRYVIGQKLSEMALIEWELHSRVAADLAAENTDPIGVVTIMHRLARANPTPAKADKVLCLHSLVRFNGIDAAEYDYLCVGIKYESTKKLIRVIPTSIIEKAPDTWDNMAFWVPAEHMTVSRELTEDQARRIMKGELNV